MPKKLVRQLFKEFSKNLSEEFLNEVICGQTP